MVSVPFDSLPRRGARRSERGSNQRRQTSRMLQELIWNRYRPAIGSPDWIRYWGKRTFLLGELMARSWSQWRYRSQSAHLGQRTVISPSRISGNVEHLRIGNDCAIGRVDIQLHAPVTIGDCVVI